MCKESRVATQVSETTIHLPADDETASEHFVLITCIMRDHYSGFTGRNRRNHDDMLHERSDEETNGIGKALMERKIKWSLFNSAK